MLLVGRAVAADTRYYPQTARPFSMSGCHLPSDSMGTAWQHRVGQGEWRAETDDKTGHKRTGQRFETQNLSLQASRQAREFHKKAGSGRTHEALLGG